MLHRNETRSQKRGGPGPTKTEASTRKMEKPMDEGNAPATEGNPAHNGAKDDTGDLLRLGTPMHFAIVRLPSFRPDKALREHVLP